MTPLPLLAYRYTHYPIINSVVVKLARFLGIAAGIAFLFLLVSPPVIEAYSYLHLVYLILLPLSGVCYIVGRAIRVEISRIGINYYRYGLHVTSPWHEIARIEIAGDDAVGNTFVHLIRPARIVRTEFSTNLRTDIFHFSLQGYKFTPDSPLYRHIRLFAPHILPST